MTYLKIIFAYFQYFISGWSAVKIAVLAAAVPVVVVLIQLIAYSAAGRFVKAYAKLKRFLKHNSYVTSVNLFVFNKKVAHVFPRRIRKALQSMEGKEITAQELVTIFENYIPRKATSIMRTGSIVHLITLSVIIALSGYGLAAVAFVAACMSGVWWLFAIGCNLIGRLYRLRENKYKRDFIFALNHSVRQSSVFSLGSIEDVKTLKEDSVGELAAGVENFLSTNPDKSLAKVVLKSLYSANYTSAMSKESVFALKSAMQKLKEYVV